MFESEVGAKVAATRQNLGTGNWGNDVPSGAVKVPASTGVAALMVVSGSAKPARLAQVAAADGVTPMPRANAIAAAKPTDSTLFLISESSPRGDRIVLLCRLSPTIGQPAHPSN